MSNTSITDNPQDTQKQQTKTQILINVNTRAPYNGFSNVLDLDQILQ